MRRNERGSMAIEAVLLTPVLVAAIIMIATGSRYVDARSQANHAARQASEGLGCTIFTTSASDGVLPIAAFSSCFSVAAASQSCTSFLGRVPSDLRPSAPLRSICTKARSVLPLSTTRPNTCASTASRW